MTRLRERCKDESGSAMVVGVVMMLWGQLFHHGAPNAHDQTRPGAHS